MANGALPQESQGRSLEGVAFRPSNDEELAEAIDLAFDYRGDVRLELRSGESIEGYLFNRDAEASPPFLQLYTLNAMQPIKVFYHQVARILFSGEDTAFGKSWNDWLRKKRSLHSKSSSIRPDES